MVLKVGDRIAWAGNELRIRQVLRHLPGKRWVGQVDWQQQKAVLKLFYGPKKHRDYRRELKGLHGLEKAGVLSPQPIQQGIWQDHPFLILPWIEGQSLEQAWQASDAAQKKALWQVLSADLVRLHRAGIWSSDAHWQNILIDGQNRCWWLDGGDYHQARAPLPPRLARRHLAILLAHFNEQLPDWQAYMEACGDDFSAQLDRAIFRQRYRRALKISRKALRDCTEFQAWSWRDYRIVQRRELDQTVLKNWLQQGAPVAQMLKAGRSQTVWLDQLWQRPVVVKRYNIKSRWQRLKRRWRSRAQRAWLNAHRLRAYGIPTPQPLAWIEHQDGRAWILMERAMGLGLDDYFQHYPQDHSAWQVVIQLLADLRRLRIVHGDLKASNIILDPQSHRIQLIDLDSMRFPRFWARSGLKRDQRRFQLNGIQPPPR